MASSLGSYVVNAFDDKTFSPLARPTAQLAARLQNVAMQPALVFSKDIQHSAYVWASLIIISLHLLAVWGYLNDKEPPPLPKPKHQVAIEFIKIPPPVIEPPPPPSPKVEKVAAPTPAQPLAALKTAPAVDNVTPTDLTVQENTHAETTSGPVMAASGLLEKSAPVPEVQAPPPPKVEEPITEASANAGYLNNPKPAYPAQAITMGWGGTVIMRVRVLANGSVESVTIKKSSGRKVLDEAALSTVQKWIFVPSKRGSTPIDGWATVPIIFNPEQ